MGGRIWERSPSLPLHVTEDLRRTNTYVNTNKLINIKIHNKHANLKRRRNTSVPSGTRARKPAEGGPNGLRTRLVPWGPEPQEANTPSPLLTSGGIALRGAVLALLGAEQHP